jgi:predicted DsbA family dithiol-disulfide isomerase
MAERFEIVMRSFELYPAASREPETIEKAFIRSHGGTAAHFLRAERQMQAIARKEGLEFSLDRFSAHTFDLHRVVQYAGERVREILADDEYADRVRGDRAEGMELGARGVPFVAADRRVAAAGAQKTAGYSQLLEQVAGPASTERVS